MAKRTKQSGLFDREIEDKDVEQALIEAIETLDDEEFREAAKARAAAKALIDETFAGMKLKDGERVRVGEYIVPVVTRTGGDFEIKPWKRVGVGPIKRIDANAEPV
jgi:hypothetical protein